MIYKCFYPEMFCRYLPYSDPNWKVTVRYHREDNEEGVDVGHVVHDEPGHGDRGHVGEECVTPEHNVENIGKGECILPSIAVTDVAEN